MPEAFKERYWPCLCCQPPHMNPAILLPQIVGSLHSLSQHCVPIDLVSGQSSGSAYKLVISCTAARFR